MKRVPPMEGEELRRKVERDVTRIFDALHQDLPDRIEDKILAKVASVSPRPGNAGSPHATGELGGSFRELGGDRDGVGTRVEHAPIIDRGRKPDRNGRTIGSRVLPTGFSDAFARLAAEALGDVALTVDREFLR